MRDRSITPRWSQPRLSLDWSDVAPARHGWSSSTRPARSAGVAYSYLARAETVAPRARATRPDVHHAMAFTLLIALASSGFLSGGPSTSASLRPQLIRGNPICAYGGGGGRGRGGGRGSQGSSRGRAYSPANRAQYKQNAKAANDASVDKKMAADASFFWECVQKHGEGKDREALHNNFGRESSASSRSASVIFSRLSRGQTTDLCNGTSPPSSCAREIGKEAGTVDSRHVKSQTARARSTTSSTTNLRSQASAQ